MAIAQRAMKLDCGIDHLMHHVGEEYLGDAVFVSNVHAFFRFVSDVEQDKSGFINLRGAIREHPAHALAIC